MPKNLKSTLSKSKLVSNFSYLSLLQLITVLIPLLIYPFLLLRLGGEIYGKIIYASALNAYLLVLVNYGFDISVVNSIAENRKNKNKLLNLFINIMWSKIFLLIISYLLLLIGMFTIPFIIENKMLCILTSLVTIGELFLPRWYFLGIEQLKYTTFSVVISKILSILLLFIFIKNEEDYLLVPIFIGVGGIVGGIFSMNRALKDLIIGENSSWNKFRPNINTIRSLIINDFTFFLSRGFVVIREKAGILIIGQLFGFTEVSAFDFVQKIIRVLTIPIDMINMVIFPRVAKTKDFKFVKKGILVSLSYAVFCYLIILLFPFNSIEYFKDSSIFNLVIPLMYIFGFGLILQVFVYFSGNTVLLVYGYKKEFNYTVIQGGFIYLLLLIYGYLSDISIEWIGYCTIISYLYIILARVYFINKYELWNGRQTSI
jgi:PST family polysaccharide transporter